jgi:chromate transporter
MSGLSQQSTGNGSQPRQVSLWTLAGTFLLMGFTAFGFTILQNLKDLVKKRGWLSDETVDEGLALVQLYPGPMNFDFTAFIGYQLRGLPGSLLAVIGLLVPSFVIMTAFSAAYFSYGKVAIGTQIFAALEALIVGVIFNLTLDFGERQLKGRVHAVIALGAFFALLVNFNSALLVALALLLGVLLLRPAKNLQSAPVNVSLSRGSWWAIAISAAVVLAGVAYTALLGGTLGAMGLDCFKIGSIAFGNGAAILPILRADVVQTFHWLTPAEFADGAVIGQITPGPFLITAAFVGYKMGGLGGAALATFAVFSPSFVFTLVACELYRQLRSNRYVQGALSGVMAAFVGLLAGVTLQFAETGISGPKSLLFAGAALIGVHYFKLDVVWIFLGGLALWFLASALGWAG